MDRRVRLALAAVALVFAVLHLAALPSTLEDHDSINFALGVESFAPVKHQPHPPGYPVYILLAKASTSTLRWVAPRWGRDRRAAVGLALWSVIAGTLGIFALWWFWTSLGLSSSQAFLATLAGVSAPLYWFTASRPMTDMPGVFAALAVQAALLKGMTARPTRLPHIWLWAAVGAGLAIGLRTQTMWLTLPIVGWAFADVLRHRQWRHAALLATCFVTGVLVWLVPLTWAVGGPGEYLSVLSSQANQDFSSVQMLVTTPSWAVFRVALSETFLAPWNVVGAGLVVLPLAAMGVWHLGRQDARSPLLIGLLLVPYFIFHVLFQEVETLRYALPLTVVIAGLSSIGLRWIVGQRLGTIAISSLALASVLIVQPILRDYSHGAPVFQALRETQRQWDAAPNPPLLKMHHQAWWAIRRSLDWYRNIWDVGERDFPGDRETLAVTQHFLASSTQSVWFMADPDRNDLARFDRRTTRLRGEWRLRQGVARLIGGLRESEVSWWTIDPPFWMLGTGWSLTPELNGMTVVDGTTPTQQPATAYVRRGDAAARLLIGARNRSASAAVITLSVDGAPLRTWTVEAQQSATEWIDLPNGISAGESTYATVRLQVQGGDIRFDQFDAAPATKTMFSLGSGWGPTEYEEGTNRVWRRTRREATIEVRHGGRPVRLRLTGESPLLDFTRAPRVLVLAGDQLLDRLVPTDDFSRTVIVDPDVLDAADGRITIVVDLSRTPEERAAQVPRREFGLRVVNVEVTRVTSPAG